MTTVSSFKHEETRLSPNVGYKNLAAIDLNKKLQSIYSRVEKSPIS